ncbi:hypothetical protein [Cesiribacter andamanensis]|nr:hypothetical protein [Cesiribacter andamanensis]
MLYTRKNTQDYTSLAEQVILYAEKRGFEEIKADFDGYDKPASLNMLQQQIKLTPDFTAKRGNNKHYFELVVKNEEREDQLKLVSKWKALEMIAGMKGGRLHLFVPRGSYKFATDLVREHGIEARITKLSDIQN